VRLREKRGKREKPPELAGGVMAQPKAPVLLTTEEAAKYIGVVPGTLKNWRVQGFAPQFLRVGRGQRGPVRYRQTTDRDDWLKSRVGSHT
jgi:hypothetical protein